MLNSVGSDGVEPIWVVVVGAVVSGLTLLTKYLTDRHKSNTEIKLAESNSSGKDMKIANLSKKLEDVSLKLEAARKSENALRSNLNVLTIKLTAITGIIKELAPDKPEIIRIVDKIESNSIIN